MIDNQNEQLRKQSEYYGHISNNSNNGESKGLHYVIGDLHGKLGTYLDAVSILNDEDILYVLGDVIDRGNRGILILQDMMSRANVKLILGNHEWQFIECYKIMKKYDLSATEVMAYARINNFVKRYNDGKGGSISESTYLNGIQSIKDQLEAIGYEPKDLPKEDLSFLGLWMSNSGQKTLQSFCELSEEEQENMMSYLMNSPVIMYKQIPNKKLCLVHAAPFEKEWITKFIPSNREEEVITYTNLMDLKPKGRECFISMCTERRQEAFKKGMPSPFDIMKDLGYETIFGHTSQHIKATRCKKDGSLCLDISSCDGAAIYCAEAGLVQYIDRSFEKPTGNISKPEEPLLLENRSIDLLDTLEGLHIAKDLIEAQFGPEKNEQSSQSSGPEDR